MEPGSRDFRRLCAETEGVDRWQVFVKGVVIDETVAGIETEAILCCEAV